MADGVFDPAIFDPAIFDIGHIDHAATLYPRIGRGASDPLDLFVDIGHTQLRTMNG